MGISISRNLAEKSDALAREMSITRSRLYARALREFMMRHENASLLEKLNDAYGDEPDPEETKLLKSAKRHTGRLLGENER